MICKYFLSVALLKGIDYLNGGCHWLRSSVILQWDQIGALRTKKGILWTGSSCRRAGAEDCIFGRRHHVSSWMGLAMVKQLLLPLLSVTGWFRENTAIGCNVMDRKYNCVRPRQPSNGGGVLKSFYIRGLKKTNRLSNHRSSVNPLVTQPGQPPTTLRGVFSSHWRDYLLPCPFMELPFRCHHCISTMGMPFLVQDRETYLSYLISFFCFLLFGRL